MPAQHTWNYQKTISNSVSIDGSHDDLKELMDSYGVSPHEEAEYGHGEYDSSWTYRIWDTGLFQIAGSHPRDLETRDTEYEEPVILLAQISNFLGEQLELMFIGDFEDKGSELEAEKWIIKESHIGHIRFTNSKRSPASGYDYTEYDIKEVIEESSEYIDKLKR